MDCDWTQVLAYFAVSFLSSWWYFDRKYRKRLNSLSDKIEDLMVDRYRSRKDIVNLLNTLSDQAGELEMRDAKIEELTKNANLNMFMRSELPMRPKRARSETPA